MCPGGVPKFLAVIRRHTERLFQSMEYSQNTLMQCVRGLCSFYSSTINDSEIDDRVLAVVEDTQRSKRVYVIRAARHRPG